MTQKNDDVSDAYVVTITDCRTAGFCARGIAGYLGGLGINYKDLKADKVTIGQLRKLPSDANVDAVIRVVIAREQEHGR